MTQKHADDERIQSLLDWHADLIVHGQRDRAAAMADRLAAGPADASLFSIADSLGVTLAPVPPDPGFRLHLRGVLETPEAATLAHREDEWSPQRSWSDLVPKALSAVRQRGAGEQDEPSAVSFSTRRVVSSVAAASVVGVAAAWWVARGLRRSYIPAQPSQAATDSPGQA